MNDSHLKYSEVMLDGKFVSCDKIDPGSHQYIGIFRPPVAPGMTGGYLICPGCGSILQTLENNIAHYRLGHFDIPQYITIKKGEKAEGQKETDAFQQKTFVVRWDIDSKIRINRKTIFSALGAYFDEEETFYVVELIETSSNT